MDQLTDLHSYSLALIITTGLIAGLGGSVHCTGMCGGLVMALTRNKKEILNYHLGRLIGYLTIGLIIPMLGLEVFNLKDNKTLSIIAGATLGLTFIYLGLKSYFKWQINFTFHRSLEQLNQRIWKRLLVKETSGLVKSFVGGLTSVFLPCGLLWAVIVLSFTATTPLYGAVFIFTFWLGTTPALSFSPVLIKKVFLPIQQRLPRLTPVFFILLGCGTLFFRVYKVMTHTGGPMCH